MAQASFFCPHCKTQRLFTGEEMSHVAHILASVFLCGLWLPIWLISAATYRPQYHCSQCGFSDSIKYLQNPNLRRIEQEQVRNYVPPEPSAFSQWMNAEGNGWKVGTIVLGIVILLVGGMYLAIKLNKPQQNQSTGVIVHSTPSTTPISNIEILREVREYLAANRGKMTDGHYLAVYLKLNQIPKNTLEYNAAQKILQQYKKEIETARRNLNR